MSTATRPFQFVTASYLTCVENQRARTLSELLVCLEQASDDALFYHTFQSLGRCHFLTEGFSNDFAQWALAGLNQPVLAEQLGSIDVRDYLSIADLRRDLVAIVDGYLRTHENVGKQEAFETFHFCRAAGVTCPLPWDAHTLLGFRAGLERLSHASFHHHFIASRIRLQLRTNDFSHWFSNALGLNRLAEQTNRIDIYTNTLDTARQELAEMIDQEIGP